MKTILFSSRNPKTNTFGLPFMINYSDDTNYVRSELARFVDVGIRSYTIDLGDLFQNDNKAEFDFMLNSFVRFYRSNLISFGTFDDSEGYKPFDLYDFYIPEFCDNPLKYLRDDFYAYDPKLIDIVKGALCENSCIQ